MLRQIVLRNRALRYHTSFSDTSFHDSSLCDTRLCDTNVCGSSQLGQAASDGMCVRESTYEAARDLCTELGARLCTVGELERGEDRVVPEDAPRGLVKALKFKNSVEAEIEKLNKEILDLKAKCEESEKAFEEKASK